MNRCLYFVLLIAFFAEETYGQDETGNRVNDVLSSEETGNTTSVERSVSTNEAIELATKPVTSWVEDKIQNSSLIQSSAHSRERPEQEDNERTLREAILLAREQFSGSVLSAERIEEQDRKSFRIKILSDAGILKVVDVDAMKDNLVTEPATESNSRLIEGAE